MYEDLTQEFQAHWIFQSKPLWFIEAVALGVGAAKYDWVYLLNTDMVLDPAALREVAKWRARLFLRSHHRSTFRIRPAGVKNRLDRNSRCGRPSRNSGCGA